MKVRYNRQINKQVVYLGFLEFPDFVRMLLGILLFGALQRLHIAALYLLVYVSFMAATRIGKAPGYAQHVWRKLMSPTHRRPGHAEILYPINPRSIK
jgi:hypothetical protein